MIEQVPPESSGSDAQLWLRPRRALTAGQFALLGSVLAVLVWSLALLAYWQGNAFAPAFALFDSALLAAALRWVWQDGERFELIAWGERTLEVRRSRQPEPAFRADPHWIRLQVTREAGEARVHLRSQGREVEVGAFLSESERIDLAARLQGLLAAVCEGERRSLITA